MILEIPYRKGNVVLDVPAIVVEIKSPDDTDPENKRGWLFQKGSLQLLTGASIALTLPQQNMPIELPFGQMFAELEEE